MKVVLKNKQSQGHRIKGGKLQHQPCTMKLVLLTVMAAIVMTASCSGACPLWFRHNKSTGQCECGDNLGGLVHCDKQTKRVSVLFCYCMTYSEKMDITVVGPCLELCTRRDTPKCRSFNLIKTNKTSSINTEMCGGRHRDGLLCGECREGYAPPVYSYTLKCVNCTDSDFTKNLIQYMAVSFLPLTMIYLVVIIFKVSVTSGNMVAYVFTSQILTAPILLRSITHGDSNHALLSLFTIWNLDPLRLASPPFCLHPNMTILHVLSLDYLIGVYPLFLIVLTYIAVTLHDRYPIVVKIWRPAYRVLRCIRREWNIRGSLIQAFATFLTLSYVKMLTTSFDLLTPVHLKTVEGRTLNQTHLFINGEIAFFGSEHLPYGVLAVVVLAVFNLMPTLLLLLYPSKCFQKCLKRCRLRSDTLHSIMDAFHGCYHRDCRYFAGFYILARSVFLCTSVFIQDSTAFAIFGFYFTGLTILVIAFEPYKAKHHNTIDTTFFLLYATLSFIGSLYVSLAAAEPQIKVQPIFTSIISLMSALFILYGVVSLLQKITPNKLLVWVKDQWKKLNSKGNGDSSTGHADDDFPYRFETNN